ncbi:hypothetical protein ACFWPQ_22885 [Streptomyces sp. NPDC058464]|uniref:hypothetical protein n=1 Tax=Streptomyces sp. NPDC058464 TaxID=3346511 RepID=UPI0036581F66
MTMIERAGPDAFSLRRPATGLDIENMSLHDHVPNKEALLDGVAEAILARIDFPDLSVGTRQDRIRAHAVAFRAVAERHPRRSRCPYLAVIDHDVEFYYGLWNC